VTTGAIPSEDQGDVPPSTAGQVFTVGEDLTTGFSDPCDFLALMAGAFPKDSTLQLGFIGEGRRKRREQYPVSVDGLNNAWSDIDYFNDNDEQRHIYFSPFARSRSLRGAASVLEMGAVCVDLDCGEGQLQDGTHRAKFPDKEAARRHLDNLIADGGIPPPTFIVDSGGGLHVHWLLSKPLPRSEETQHRRIMLGLAIILGGDMSVARHLDTQMRVPATTNWKDRTGNQLARVLHFEDVAHAIDEFPAATDEDIIRYAGNRKRHTSKRTRQTRSTRPSHVHQILASALDDAGVSTRPAWDGRGEFVRTDLETCPLCGSEPGDDGSVRTWTAGISPHLLRLHCWRPRCPANKNPLPIQEWLPLVLPDPPRSLDGILPINIEDCRQVLDATIATAFDLATRPNVIPIIEGDLGCGKTTRMLHRMIQDAVEGRGGTLVLPSHLLAQEKAEQLRDIAHSADADIKVIQATSMAQCCIYKDRLRKWARHIHSWTHQVCRSCDHFNECAVHSQFKDLDRAHTIVVGVHSYLPQMNHQGVLGDYVVVDEASSSFEKEQQWTRSHIEGILKSEHPWCQVRHLAAGFLLALLRKAEDHHQALKSSTDEGEDPPARFGLYISGEELEKLVAEVEDIQSLHFDKDCRYHTNQSPPRQGFDLLTQKNPSRSTVPLDFDDLVHHLEDVAVFFKSDNATPVFLRFHLEIPQLEVPVIMMDATASSSIATLQACHPDTTFELMPVRVHEPSQVRRLHLQTSSYQSKRVSSDPARVRKSLTLDGKKILRKVREWWSNPGDPTYGLIAPKKIEDDAAKVFKELGVDPITGHYGDIRGTNRFENVNVLVLIGDFVPNVNRCKYESHILGIGVNDRVWSIRRSEALQAAGRARAIRRGGESPLLIFSLSDRYVLDRTADEEITTTPGRPGGKWERVADIAAGFLEAHGFVATRLCYPPGVGGWLLEVGLNGHIKNVFNSQLSPTPSGTQETLTPSQLRQLRRTIPEVAKQSGATARWVPIQGGRMQVWETQDGAYQKWLNQSGGKADAEV
jgi:hypothetical protein